VGSRNKPINTPAISLEDHTNSPMLRRFQFLLGRITSDLGGEAELSTGQVQLARRAAWISTQCY
jgi:hypothetical protein